MALKDWLDAGKCALGLHEGDWARETADSCELAQTCVRCHTISKRVEHDFAEWRAAPQACEWVRSCNRCAQQETRLEHHWGTWTYRLDETCQQGIPCTNCSAWSDQSRVEHDWGNWEYNEHYRAPLHTCSRCELVASYFPQQVIDPALPDLQEPVAGDTAAEEMPLREADRDESPDLNLGPQEVRDLRQMFEEQIRAGIISPERQPLLNSLLGELEDVVGQPSSDPPTQARRLQDAMLRLREAVLDPSRGSASDKPLPGTRLALIAQLHAELFRYVYTETTNGMFTGQEAQAGFRLLGQMRDIREAIANLAPARDPLKLECESLRPLALEVRDFSLRHHLTLIRPIWPSDTIVQNPGAVFYSGGEQVGEMVERLIPGRKLNRLRAEPGREPASRRWNQLREAALGVFDFTSFSRNALLEDASPVATVAYELGMALTLGRPVVIVASENQDLPFDLDIEPIRVNPSDRESNAFALAIDQALYGLQRSRAGTSIAQSIQNLRAEFRDHPDSRVRYSLASIDDKVAQDPVQSRLLIASLFGFIGAEAPQIAFPTWPGSYPNPGQKRCFHVTAFGPPWAGATSQIVEQACGTAVEYIRGDRVLAPDILRSIWDGICSATHIVVDLTGLNANVALELGIAHALGRNIMLISQDQQPKQHFRAISKQRIHHYTLGGDQALVDLRSTLEKFFT
jgi:hypothetical protein